MNETDFNENEDAASTNEDAFGVDFPSATATTTEAKLPLNRFYDVNVSVSVELGRLEMPIGEMLKLGDGAVVELSRSVSEEVDIIAQGVRIAKGEVVVVEDRFAVRITQIEDDEQSA